MPAERKLSLADETIATLRDLIHANIESRDSFNRAAERIDDASLAAMFQELALERNDQVSELRTLLAANFVEPPTNGTVKAAAKRAWMDLKTALGAGASAMLAEAERCENLIKKSYEDALRDHGDGAAADVLQQHCAAVRSSHDRLRELRDNARNGRPVVSRR
jgi:uncharacterized protein (TIGR02284 family)